MLRVNNSLRMASAVAAALAAPILFARPVHSQGAVTTPEPALSPKEFRPFVLKSAEQLTRDTKRYVFSLPDEQSDLGLSVASCLVIKANVNGAYINMLPVIHLCFRAMYMSNFPCRVIFFIRTRMSTYRDRLKCIQLERFIALSK